MLPGSCLQEGRPCSAQPNDRRPVCVCVCVCVWRGDLGSRWAWTFVFMYLHFVSLVSKVWQNIIELCQRLC